MHWPSIIRIILIAVSATVFFVLAKRLTRMPLQGFLLIGAGLAGILLNALIGAVYHSELLSGEESASEWILPLGVLTGYVIMPAGFVLLLLGAYRLLKSLREQLNPHYSVLVEKSLVGVYRLENGVLSYVNPRFAEIMDGQASDFAGRHFSELVAGKDRARVAEFVDGGSGKDNRHRWEFNGITRSGRETTLETYGDEVQVGDKRIFQGTLIDIGERSKFQHLLQTREERHRHLLEHCQDAILLHSNGVIQYCNRSGVTLLGGADCESLEGADLLEFFPPEVREETRKRLEDIVRQGIQEHLPDCRLIDRSGRAIPAEISNLPCNPAGDFAVQTIIRDLSRQKEAESLFDSQKTLLEKVAHGASLPEILDDTTRLIERQQNSLRCAIFLLDDSGQNLMLGSAPGMSGDFSRNLSSVSLQTSCGPCITAVLDDRVVIIEDIFADPLWQPIVQIAGSEGIRSCCSLPIHSLGNKVVGTIATYFDAPGGPTSRQLELMKIAADIVRIALENRELEIASLGSESRYRKLFEGISDAVVVFPLPLPGKPVKPIEANRIACDMLGYPREQLLQLDLDALLAPGLLASSRWRLRDLRRNGTVLLEVAGWTSSGQPLPFEVNMQLLEVNGQQSVLAIARNITERKAEEMALREKEEHFRSLIHYSSDVITVLSREGTIMYLSESVESALGYPASLLLGKCIFDYIQPDEMPILKKHFAELCNRNDQKIPVENRFKHLDGRWIYMESIGTNLCDNPVIGGLVINSRNITERKMVEQALKESEERFRTIFDNSGIGVVLLKLDGMILEANPSFREMSGHRDNPVRGRSFAGLWEEEPTSLQPQQLVKKLAVKPYRYQLECDLQPPQSQTLAARITASMITNSDSEPQFIIVMLEDITARNNAIKALQDSEERYRDIVENSADFIFSHDLQGQISSVNRAMVEQLGFTGDAELVGSSLNDFITPRSTETFQFYLEKIAGEEQSSGHISVITAGGGFYILEYRNSIRRIGRKEPLVRVIARNVTEHFFMQQELAEEKERLSVTLRNIGDGVLAVNLAGQITLINRVAEKLTGWSPREAIGQQLNTVFRSFHSKKGKAVLDPIKDVLEDERMISHNLPVELHSRDGRIYTVTSNATPMRDNDNKTVGVVLVFHDVSMQVALEEELRRTQKLESLGILAGGIAHDFNNILTAIVGNISLGKLSASADDIVKLRLNEAESAAMRARELTQQLLTFARGGAPVKKAASIADILTETAEFALRGSNTKCEYTIERNLWPVEVDKGQISQVINNLVINSMQAMPRGGHIYIACENLMLEGTSHWRDTPIVPGYYVRIRVRDEGVGIPREFLEQVFDPYFTTKQKGSGLGLATSYSIIKKHDGYIFVDSKPMEGSEFVLLLPAAPDMQLSEDVAANSIIKGSGRILLMDDEETILDLAGNMLTYLGYSVDHTRDGMAAVAAYKDALESGNAYSAIIVDLTVPGGLGGKDTVQELQQIDPGLIAIVSSGYSNDPVMAEYQKFGFAGRLMKPYNLQHMSEVLRDVLNGKLQNQVKSHERRAEDNV